MSKPRNSKLTLLKGRAVSETMAEDISEELGIDYCPRTVKDFPDGETYCHIKRSVRGDECFIIQPTCRSEDCGINNNLWELLIFLDTLKRASAKKEKLTAVIPYYGYGRQDRKTTGREPISAKLVANLITTAGATRILTVDLHAGQIQGFFDIPVDNLSAAFRDIIGKAVNKIIERAGENNLVIASPDVGSAKKTRKISGKFNKEMVIIEKERRNGKVKALNLIGEVKGRDVVIIDDIISTAGTLTEAVRLLKEKGAERVWAAVTHGIFAGEAIERIENSPIEKVFVTDSVPLLPKVKQCNQIETVRIGHIIGKAIRAIYEERSVSEMFPHT